MADFFVGLDLGQARDPSALVVVQRVAFLPDPPVSNPRRRVAFPPKPRPPETHYHVRLCERLRLGTPYADVVRRLVSVVGSIDAPADVVVDATGVGRPIVELIESAGVYPIAVTITGADSADESGRSWRVPKRDLVSTLEVLLQERRLKIGRDADGTSALIDELIAFRATVSPSGHDTYAGEGSAHDDLVIALALSCWRARQTDREPQQPMIRGISEWTPPEDDDPFDHSWVLGRASMRRPMDRFIGPGVTFRPAAPRPPPVDHGSSGGARFLRRPFRKM
ncbi:MAG TPA: hypothetical protein VGH28_02135 [Polyangiaceae bacterium]|jgi:hypothetical protein